MYSINVISYSIIVLDELYNMNELDNQNEPKKKFKIFERYQYNPKMNAEKFGPDQM